MFSILAPLQERAAYIINTEYGTPISIHTPSRERPVRRFIVKYGVHFNPRSLTGATSQRPE